MHGFATNRNNGKRYAASAEHWPEHGWYIKIYDRDPNAWGRAEDGIGPGPVTDQGWKTDLERRGFDFAPIPEPTNVRDQEMKRLAGSMQTASAPCPVCKGNGNVGGSKCPSCQGKGIATPKPASPPPAQEGKIDWSKRLAALRKRRGESVAESLVTKLLG